MNRPKTRGFTLIELLVVIAIIALLAAIIFPVVTSAKANVKKTSCINNLHNIAQGLKMYKLDEGRYPAQLFPYDPDADPTVPGQEGKRGMQDAVGPLYPNYVKSIEIFHCPMDWQYEDEEYAGRGPNYDPGTHLIMYGDPVDPNIQYTAYPYDSYSGQFGKIWGEGAAGWEVNVAEYEGRYYLFREPEGSFVPGSPHYKRQLRFRNPPADTVVTWCGAHRDFSAKNGDIWTVKKGSVDIVLFLDGSARAVNTEQSLMGVNEDGTYHYGFVEPR